MFPRLGRRPLLAALLALAFAAPAVAQEPLELVFTSGSEKKEWLAAVTADYLKTNPMVNGRPVKIVLVSMGSGELMEAIRDPEKWEESAEAEIKRTADDLKRIEDELKANPDDKALQKRKEDAVKAGKKAKETKMAARAHLVSPASLAFIRLANAECKAANQPDVVVPGKAEDSLIKSAVVIAMWEDMARKLGWPDKEVGWADVFALAQDPKGWNGKFPGSGWGRFKFGHTHPELSNSGLLAVLAEAYYGAGKVEKLTKEDVVKKEVAERMTEIEKSVLFYGQSTGFFGDTMVSGGSGVLSAGILYEDQIIKANDPDAKVKPDKKLVAIYPAEGTFMSDHPVSIVKRDKWVTADHVKAAEAYIEFLRDEDQQKKAMEFGFRPSKKLKLDAVKFSADRGVDPNKQITELEVPDAEVMKAVIDLWKQVRKPLRVALVIDTSGSMVAPDKEKFAAAKVAAERFVEKLSPRDELTLLAFNDAPHEWAIGKPLKMDPAGKKAAVAAINGLRAEFQTCLYDAIKLAFDQIREEGKATRDFTTAIVVLSDGADYGQNYLVKRGNKLMSVAPKAKLPTDEVIVKNNKEVRLGSSITLEDVLDLTKFNPEETATRVFTIAYGADAEPETLDKIARNTRAVMYPSTKGDIERVLKLILQDQ